MKLPWNTLERPFNVNTQKYPKTPKNNQEQPKTSWAALESNFLLSWMADYPWGGGWTTFGWRVTIPRMVGKILIWGLSLCSKFQVCFTLYSYRFWRDCSCPSCDRNKVNSDLKLDWSLTKKKLRLNKKFVDKNVSPRKILLVTKYLWTQNSFIRKKTGSTKFWVRRYFKSKKFESRKCLGLKNFRSKKFPRSHKMLTKQNFGKRISKKTRLVKYWALNTWSKLGQ